MAPTRPAGPPEVGQDLRFQQGQWTAQRWAWGILLGVLAAALAGLLGPGLLSRTSAADPDGNVRVEYDRFLHRQAEAVARVTLGPAATRDGTVRVWFGEGFLRAVQIRHVTPRPEREEAGPDRHVFVFRVAAPGEPVGIDVHFVPGGIGTLPGRVGIGDGPAVGFDSFVYP